MEAMMLIISIVERGKGAAMQKLYRSRQVILHLQCPGMGTATSEIMDILGLGGSEKDIILSFAPAGTALNLLEKLKDDLHDLCPGRGIAFMVAMEAVTNLLAASMGARKKLEKDREYEDMQEKNSLIMITVNQGFTDEVMSTAKEAGARGGTVVRGRWVMMDEIEQMKGLMLREEKEIILIVVPPEIRNSVMDAVNTHHGLQSEAGAVICSLGVEHMAHLG